jgi:hypothetical protein
MTLTFGDFVVARDLLTLWSWFLPGFTEIKAGVLKSSPGV